MHDILKSIKKMLGINADYEHFDDELIIYINSAFSVLTQLGVGPKEGFVISGCNHDWEDFIDDDRMQFVKTYVYLRVRMSFDPPTVGSAKDSFDKQIKELEWRLNVAAEDRTGGANNG